jgi:hypothetical protein
VKLALAMLEKARCFERVRAYRELAKKKPPRAAVGHMPFPGHRTQAQVKAQERC